MSKAVTIKRKLFLADYRRRAIKFHDRLILQYLNCLKENNHEPEDPNVTTKYLQLDAIWIEECERRRYPEEAKTIFKEQISRIIKQVESEHNSKAPMV